MRALLPWCVVFLAQSVEAVATGDILFIKGSKYPHGVKGLVHKSPEKRYKEDGNILNRLVLKVDVDALPSTEPPAIDGPVDWLARAAAVARPKP